MPKTVIKTVKSSLGDYSSLSAFESGERRDLTSADEIAAAECYAFPDTTGVTFASANWTTDSTRYVRIYTPLSERHRGRWSTGAYRLDGSRDWFGMLRVQCDARIDGLQVKNTNTTNACLGIDAISVCGTLHVINSIVVGNDTASDSKGISMPAASNTQFYCINNVVYGFDDGITMYQNNNGQTVVYYNNTVDCTGTDFYAANYGTTPTLSMYNNISQGSGTGYGANMDSFDTFVHDSNISLDTSSPDSAYRQKTVTFAGLPDGDYHIAISDTEARGRGVDLSGDSYYPFNADVDGHRRYGLWDIGADQYSQKPDVRRGPIIIVPKYAAIPDYRYKPPRSMFARGPHECHPSFRSIWDGLTVAWMFMEPGGESDGDPVPEFFGQNPLALNVSFGSVTYVLGDRGLACRCDSASGNQGGLDGTLVGRAIPDQAVGGTHAFYGKIIQWADSDTNFLDSTPVAGNGGIGFRSMSTPSSTMRWVGTNSSDSIVWDCQTATGVPTAGETDLWCGTWDVATTDAYIYKSGVVVASDTSWAASPAGTFANFDVHTGGGGDDKMFDYYYIAFWNRPLTPGEAVLLGAHPFGPFWRWA